MSTLEYLQFFCLRTFINLNLAVRRSAFFSPTTQPDQVKSYSNHTYLFWSRIFKPRDVSQGAKIPLVIRIHGGGFILNNPSLDDPMARYLADHANCVVVSIDYGKAPQHKFPAAYEEVIAQTLAIINDSELPCDPARVIISGSSAGSNLGLAASQDPRLRTKIFGIGAIYTPLDLFQDPETKMSTRPDPSIPDFMGVETFKRVSKLLFDPANVPSPDDPRVNPSRFISRDHLPPHILMQGVEHDMFCHELESMANRILTESGGSKEATKTGWKAPGIQWQKILGQRHAFDVFPAKDPVAEQARLGAVDELYSTLAKWIVEICADNTAA